MLFFFFVLSHNIGQFDVALVSHLTGISKGVHLFNLTLQLEAFRVCKAIFIRGSTGDYRLTFNMTYVFNELIVVVDKFKVISQADSVVRVIMP